MSPPGRDDRKAAGSRGEALARAHLEANGLELVAQNWKAPPRPGFGGHGGELDLVMRDGDVLVVIEVRTARAGFAGGAAYTVGPAKRRQIASLTQRFLLASKLRPKALRFDVVALDTVVGGSTLHWYRNAFTT